MLVNEELKNMMLKQAELLKTQGQSEGFLDEKMFGQLRVFINQEPSSFLIQLTSGQDIIYLGSNEL